MQNKVAAVVVTFNRVDLLIESIEALKAQSYPCDIVIINNASTDDTEERLATYRQNNEIVYFNTGENLGGAGGFNYGVKQAYELGYDYFWLMDDDSIANSNALEALMKADEELKGEYGFLSSYVNWKDGSACKMNIPEISKNWTVDIELSKKGLIRVSRATFVAFFTRREVVENVGLPIKEFFIWGDDTNYCWRINEKYKSYLVVDSKVLHKIVTNSDADIMSDDSGRLPRYVYAFRNRYYNYKHHKSTGEYHRYVMKKIYSILFRAKDKKLKRIHYMLKGARAGKKFNPQIEYVNKK